MSSVNFTLGDDFGKRIMEIAQEKLLYKYDGEGAVFLLTESFPGMSRNIALQIIKGDCVIDVDEDGVNWHGFAGNILDSVYYISESRAISCDNTYDIVFEDGIKEFITFTLEEFEQKFPYKVGDKVNYVKYNDEYPNVYTIQKMWWNGVTIEYVLDSSGFSALTKDLQPYKEQITETHPKW